MIRVDAGTPGGRSRRDFLRLGLGGAAAFSLPSILRARDGGSKDTRVILLWLEGGPSHMDLWDMKPEAPPEYRGFWRPIATNVPGMRITEMFPRQAKLADKFSILRTLHHDDGDHIGSAHILLTGRPGPTVADQAPKSPSIGSIAARLAGARRPALPPFVAVPRAGSPYFGAQYAGRAFDPFETGGSPESPAFKVQNLALPAGLTPDRLDDRRGLRRTLDALRREADGTGTLDAMDRFEQQAFELVTSPAVSSAFDLSRESEKSRDRYGRNPWGQCVLLARRLAEAGVTFTVVNMGGWDQHGDLKAKMELYLPRLDAAVASLFEDLAARGLLEKTLVVVCGEMSRTPRMNGGFGGQPPGRDHWSSAISLVLGGGGVKGGRVVGATDPRGEFIVERPVTPEDLHATIYHVLGIDPATPFVNAAGRPVAALDGGRPLRELF